MNPRNHGKITLCGTALESSDELEHTLIVGGENEWVFKEILSGIAARGDRAIVAGWPGNRHGNAGDIFYSAERGDVLLDPGEVTAYRWDPFREILHEEDISELARAMVIASPHRASGQDLERAFDLLHSAIVGMRQERQSDVGELYRRVMYAHSSLHRLPGWDRVLAMHPHSDFVRARLVAFTALGALESMIPRQTGPAFCVREWVPRDAAGSFCPCISIRRKGLHR
jgi:hypothetical protein